MPEPGFLQRILWSTPGRWIVGILCGVLAAGVRIGLTPLLGERAPYVTVFAALMLVLLFLGLIPAILTLTTAWIGIWIWLLTPGSEVLDRTEIASMVAFLLFSGIIIYFAETTRRSIAKQEE